MSPARAIHDDLPRAETHRPRGTPRASRRTKWRVVSWVVVHALVIAHVAHWKLAGTTLSPVEPSEAGETLELGYVNAGFLLFVALVLATVVLGRFFCGWACHVVAYQDASAWLLAKLGLRPRPIRSRLLVLVPFLAAVMMFVLPTVARLLAGHGFPELALRVTTEDLWARFPGPWIAALTFAVDGALVVWLLGAKGFCTYACPYGALFGVADRVAPGRIRVTDACEGCGHCTATCTSNVRVHEEVARFGMVVDPGCLKCMDCVSVCPKEALFFGFAPASPRQKAKKSAGVRVRGPERRYDFTWPEEIAMALVFAASLWAWRGLYGAIPFLLALGLAVVAALSAVALWRLVARAELTLQHHALRVAGRLTRAGAGALALLCGMLALTAHGGVVRWRDGRAEQALERAQAPASAGPVSSERRAALLGEAEAHLEWIRRFGLVETADLFNKLGSIRYARGDLHGAERDLARAIELDPSFRSSRLLLADVRARRGDWNGALDELEALLAIDPVNGDAARRLEGLVRLDPANARAQALLAAIREEGANERDP